MEDEEEGIDPARNDVRACSNMLPRSNGGKNGLFTCVSQGCTDPCSVPIQWKAKTVQNSVHLRAEVE